MSSSMITGPGLDGASAIQAAGGAVQESRDLGQATPITYGQLLTIAAGGISGAGVSVSPRGSMKVATVMACARVVAWGLARMPLHVYRRTNYGRVRAWEHPTYKLLRMRPNPEMGAMSMRSALMLGALLWGNGYAEIVRNRRGEPVQIVPIESDRVCPRRLEETDELVYRVRTNRGERVLLKHEIIHVPGLSYDGITGLSVISHAREVLGASILADRMQGTLVKNNLRPSGVVIHPGKLGPQGTANLRESITRHNTGENVGVPLILEEGMTWIPGSMSLQDASWIETSRLRIEDICGLFGVPAPGPGHHILAPGPRRNQPGARAVRRGVWRLGRPGPSRHRERHAAPPWLVICQPGEHLARALLESGACAGAHAHAVSPVGVSTMPEDKFANHAPGLDSPVSKGFNITPDDDNDLALVTRGIYVGEAGDLTVILADDTSPLTYHNLPVGLWSLRIKRVLATGTNAGHLIGQI